MNRDLLRPAALALLAVVAIAVAGATIDSAVTPGEQGRDAGPDAPNRGSSEVWDISLGPAESNESGGGGMPHVPLGLCIQLLRHPLVILGLLALVGLASVPVYRRIGIIGVVSVYMVALPMGVLVYAFVTKCRAPPSNFQPPQLRFGQNNTSLGVGNGTGAGGGGVAGADPPLFLLVAVALVMVALLAALLRSTGDDDLPEEQEPEEEPDEAALSAIGEAAGDAADRIESAPGFENEVYRAWREMTDLLDVSNPETSTPGEFARVATDAGMDAEHVESLTGLFRDVRYGGAEATAEREEMAVEALRAIESAYAGEGAE